MGNNLITLLKKQALYERTVEKYENDSLISKRVLDAHLNHNSDVPSKTLCAILKK